MSVSALTSPYRLSFSFLAALAEVIILGADAQVLVVERVHLGLEVGLLFLLSFSLPFFSSGFFSSAFSASGFLPSASLGFYFGLLGLDLFLYFIGGREPAASFLLSYPCSLWSSPLIISLLCMPSGGVSPLPSLRESPAASMLSFAATAE